MTLLKSERLTANHPEHNAKAPVQLIAGGEADKQKDQHREQQEA
jgi:hypothetical protein